MKTTILATMGALALATSLSTAAFAQAVVPPGDPRAVSPGGVTDPAMAAPTGNIQGSTTGAANLNGPNGNGKTDAETAREIAHNDSQPSPYPGDNDNQMNDGR